jgi:hypothetical protein
MRLHIKAQIRLKTCDGVEIKSNFGTLQFSGARCALPNKGRISTLSKGEASRENTNRAVCLLSHVVLDAGDESRRRRRRSLTSAAEPAFWHRIGP